MVKTSDLSHDAGKGRQMILGRTSEIKENRCSNIDDDLALTTEARGGMLIVRGDVDLYAAAAFRQVAEDHVRAHASPVLDLSGVPFLDSAGLAALLMVVRVARSLSHPLQVIASGNPRRVLRLTGVDRMLVIED